MTVPFYAEDLNYDELIEATDLTGTGWEVRFKERENRLYIYVVPNDYDYIERPLTAHEAFVEVLSAASAWLDECNQYGEETGIVGELAQAIEQSMQIILAFYLDPDINERYVLDR